jgi:predicted DNA-binding transcriptional regulator YafY
MTYQGFENPEAKTAIVEPYCLKVFRQRWYLLCKNRSKNNCLRIYALDRIIELTETNEHFELESTFDAEDFFKNHFGVFIGENEKPTRIVLRAYGKMIPLIRTLPKHSSQKEIATTETYSDFEFYLAPTFDFRQEILKEGPELEVIEPKSLRKKIHDELVDTLKRYKQPR